VQGAYGIRRYRDVVGWLVVGHWRSLSWIVAIWCVWGL